MSNAMKGSEFHEIKNDRVSVVIFDGDTGKRVLTCSGLNYRAALQTILFQNSIGRPCLALSSSTPHGVTRGINSHREMRAALIKNGRLSQFSYAQRG